MASDSVLQFTLPRQEWLELCALCDANEITPNNYIADLISADRNADEKIYDRGD